jgi:hypothetical protein
VNTGVATQTENRSVLLVERPRTSVTLTVMGWPPAPSPAVENLMPFSLYWLAPRPRKLISLMVRLPTWTWILRRPEFDVNVMAGSVNPFPVLTHFALTGFVLIFGAVHVAVYRVPQRFVVARGCMAEATPEAAPANANVTTTAEMAFRNVTTPCDGVPNAICFGPARSRTHGTLPSGAAEMHLFCRP